MREDGWGSRKILCRRDAGWSKMRNFAKPGPEPEMFPLAGVRF